MNIKRIIALASLFLVVVAILGFVTHNLPDEPVRSGKAVQVSAHQPKNVAVGVGIIKFKPSGGNNNE